MVNLGVRRAGMHIQPRKPVRHVRAPVDCDAPITCRIGVPCFKTGLRKLVSRYAPSECPGVRVVMQKLPKSLG